MTIRCFECLEECPPTYTFRLYDEETECEYGFDTIDCLLAFAWRIKESQPKLSKSKEYAPILTLGPFGQGNGPFGGDCE
jgi:hypothetical protein